MSSPLAAACLSLVLVAACAAAPEPPDIRVSAAREGIAPVRAEALSATSIVVRWRLPSPPPERITVERMDRASGAFARAAVLGADAATWTAEGLVPSTFYYFRVRAEPVQGTPTESDGVVGARTLDAAETRPDAPTALSATRLSGGEGLLNWIDSSRGTARVVVERGIGDGPFGEVASLAAGMRSWLDTAAPVAQRARYRLFAENGAGRSSPSNEAVLAPIGTAPEPPARVLAATQADAVLVTWVDASAREDRFVVERDGGAGFAALAVLPADTVTKLDTQVAPGSSYRYRVRAENDYGQSIWVESNAVTLPPPAASTERVVGSAGGRFRKLVVEGTRAYVAESDELRIYDISVPAAPVRLGSLFTGDGVTLGAGDEVVGLAVAGGHAYLAVSNKGLLVVDVSAPARPRIVAERNVPGGAWSVALHGPTLYVASDDSGLAVFDVSTPATPVAHGTVRSLTIPGGSQLLLNAALVRVAGGRLLVAHRGLGSGPGVTGQLITFALSQPLAPTPIGAAWFSGTPSGIDGGDAVVAIAAGSSGLFAFTLDAAGAPTSFVARPTRAAANDVRCAGRFCYVADGIQGLTIVERSMAGLLAEVGNVDTAGEASGVDVTASHAFVADGYGGLASIAIGSSVLPGTAALLGETGSFGIFATSIAVAGTTAYVTDLDAGLALVDLSDPAAPALKAVARTVSDANGVAISGSTAIVAEGYYGAARLDIDPASATYLRTTGSVSNQYMTRGRRVAVAGRYAYLANGTFGLWVLDLGARAGDPMTRVGTLATAAAADDVVVSGTRVYVAQGSAGVLVGDVSNPAAPVALTTLTDTSPAGNGYAARIAVDGQRLYVAQLSRGLTVYDLSGALPARAGSYVSPRGVEAVVAAANRVYALTGVGYERLDASNPAAITATRSVALGVQPSDGVLVGDLLHLSIGAKGLMILRVPR